MATTTRDFAVRFTVSDNIDDATKRIEKGRERIAAQMRAMGDEYGKLNATERRELQNYALIAKSWDTSAKAAWDYFKAEQAIIALQNKGRMSGDVAQGYIEQARLDAAKRLQFEEQARDRRARSAGGRGTGVSDDAAYAAYMAEEQAKASAIAEKEAVFRARVHASEVTARVAKEKEYTAFWESELAKQSKAEAEYQAYLKAEQVKASAEAERASAQRARRHQAEVTARVAKEKEYTAFWESELAKQELAAKAHAEAQARQVVEAEAVRKRAIAEARSVEDARTKAQEATGRSLAASNAAAANPALGEEAVAARKRAEEALRSYQGAVERLAATQAEAVKLNVTGLDQEINKIKAAANADRLRIEASRQAEAKSRQAAEAGATRNRALDEARRSEELRTRMLDATQAYLGAKAAAAGDPSQVEAEIKARKQLESAVRSYRESLERLKTLQREASDRHVAGLDKEIAAIRATAAADRQRIEQSRASAAAAASAQTSRPAGYGLGSFAFPETKGLIETLNKISFSLFVITFGTQQLGEIFLRTFIQAGEKVEALRFRIEGLTGSTETFGKVAGVAMELGIGLEDLAGSFVRFALANATLGLTNDELVLMTRNIAALGLIGGGTIEEIKAGMVQLGQAMASGRLQGDELRSLMENMPYLVLKLAKSMGQPVGMMRELGKEGKIAASDVSKAMIGIKEEVDKMMENIPVTSERGIARIQTAWGEMINSMLRAIGVDTVGVWFSGIAEDMATFGKAIDNNKLMIASLIDALSSIAPAILLTVVGWKTIIPVLGMLANAIRTSIFAIIGYRDAVLTMTATQTAAMSSSTRFFAAMSATGPLTAATRAVGMITSAFFPLIAVLGVAAAAFLAYRSSRDEAMTKAQGTIDSVWNDVDALKAMSRSALLTQKTNLENELKGLQDRYVNAQDAVNRTEASLITARAMDGQGSLVAGLTEKLAQQREEVRQLTEQQERGTLALKANEEAQSGIAGAAMSAMKSVQDWSEVIKKATKDSEKFTEKLESARMELELIKKFGPGVAKDLLPGVEAQVEAGKALAELDRQRAAGESQGWTQDEADRNKAQRDAILENLRVRKELSEVERQQREETEAWNKAHKETNNTYLDHVERSIHLTELQKTRLQEYLPIIDDMAKKYGIAKEVLIAVMKAESSFNASARSPKGATGLMQVMPDTAAIIAQYDSIRQAGIKARDILNPKNPAANIEAGAAYLQWLSRRPDVNSTEDMLRGYNAGPGRIQASHKFSETNAYVAQIMGDARSLGDKKEIETTEDYWKKRQDMERESTQTMAENLQARLEMSRNYFDKERALAAQRDAEILKAEQNRNLNAAAIADARLLAEEKYSRAVEELATQRTNYQLETDRMVLENVRTNGTERSAMEKERNLAAFDYANQIRAINEEADRGDVSQGDAAARRLAEYDAFQNKLEDIKATRFNEWADEVGQAFGDAFGSMAKGGETMHDTLMRLKDALRDMIIQLLIIKPLAEMISGFIGGMVYGGVQPSESVSATKSAASMIGGAIVSGIMGYFTGGVGGAAAGATSGAYLSGGVDTSFLRNATGNLVTARLSPGLYSAPTYFPMGTPGRHAFANGTGLLGEAGPEFVMPATRMPDGRLGVAATGAGQGSSEPKWNVTVNNQAAAHGVQVNPRQDAQGGLTLDVIVAHVSNEIVRGGSPMSRSMESAYPGLRRGRMG